MTYDPNGTYVQNVDALTMIERADLKPEFERPALALFREAFQYVGEIVEITAKENSEKPDGLMPALALRSSWGTIAKVFQFMQWDMIEALDEVNRLNRRVEELGEEVAALHGEIDDRDADFNVEGRD